MSFMGRISGFMAMGLLAAAAALAQVKEVPGTAGHQHGNGRGRRPHGAGSSR